MAIFTLRFPRQQSQFFHIQNRGRTRLGPRPGRLDVEGGDDFKSFLLKAPVGKQGQPQVAHATSTTGCKLVVPRTSESYPPLVDIVTQAARAELAEISKIFAQLRGFDTGRLGQGLAGNGPMAVGLQPLQTAKITDSR